MKYDSEWAVKFSAARLGVGLSQSEAARRLKNWSVRTLQDWELGRSQPATWTQRIILRRLGEMKIFTGPVEAAQ